jgi:hypothetical protein
MIKSTTIRKIESIIDKCGSIESNDFKSIDLTGMFNTIDFINHLYNTDMAISTFEIINVNQIGVGIEQSINGKINNDIEIPFKVFSKDILEEILDILENYEVELLKTFDKIRGENY